MVRREGPRVRCFTRGGFGWADRFPGIVAATGSIKAQSFLIDGEAVVCRDDGLSDLAIGSALPPSVLPLPEHITRHDAADTIPTDRAISTVA
jgi:hypothetical protein